MSEAKAPRRSRPEDEAQGDEESKPLLHVDGSRRLHRAAAGGACGLGGNASGAEDGEDSDCSAEGNEDGCGSRGPRVSTILGGAAFVLMAVVLLFATFAGNLANGKEPFLPMHVFPNGRGGGQGDRSGMPGLVQKTSVPGGSGLPAPVSSQLQLSQGDLPDLVPAAKPEPAAAVAKPPPAAEPKEAKERAAEAAAKPAAPAKPGAPPEPKEGPAEKERPAAAAPEGRSKAAATSAEEEAREEKGKQGGDGKAVTAPPAKEDARDEKGKQGAVAKAPAATPPAQQEAREQGGKQGEAAKAAVAAPPQRGEEGKPGLPVAKAVTAAPKAEPAQEEKGKQGAVAKVTAAPEEEKGKRGGVAKVTTSLEEEKGKSGAVAKVAATSPAPSKEADNGKRPPAGLGEAAHPRNTADMDADTSRVLPMERGGGRRRGDCNATAAATTAAVGAGVAGPKLGPASGAAAATTAAPAAPAPAGTQAAPAAPTWEPVSFYIYRAQSEAHYDLQNVNVADLPGVMWYLHHEVIGATPRKYHIDRIRRYKLTVKSTREFWNVHHANLGPFMAYDGGRCTTPSCGQFYHQYGFVVGCQFQPLNEGYYMEDVQTRKYCDPGSDDCRAPMWFSLPGPCPSMGLSQPDLKGNHIALDVNKGKTADCLRRMPGGLCKKPGPPTGTPDCTYTVEDAGEILLDELAGIEDYQDFWDGSLKRCQSEHPQGGCIGNREYSAEIDAGIGNHFWDGRLDKEKCTARIEAAKALFQKHYPNLPVTLNQPVCDFDTIYGDEYTWPQNHTAAPRSAWWQQRM